MLLCNPIPESDSLDQASIEQALSAALNSAAAAKVMGKQLTPFLLGAIARETENRSVQANRALVLANAAVAGEIAVALAARRSEAAAEDGLK